jgi:RsiW-degrading membrane proteinase PrsW (M82 family)
MSGGDTTQFLFAPDMQPNNRKYLLVLASAFWTFCLGCTLLSVLLTALSGGLTGLLASPLIVAAALIPNIAIACAIPRLQRFQRTHRYVLIGAFLAGAIVAIPPALVINTTLFLPIELSMSNLLNIIGYGTIPGIVEEGIKGLIVLFIFRQFRDELYTPVDGIVLGALVGLGFAMTEDITYFFRSLEGGAIGLVLTLFLRLGLGWMNHSVFTAIIGLAFGYARLGLPGKRRWLIPLAGYIVAAGLHNTFDLLATVLGDLVPGGLLGLLLTIVPLYGLTWTALALLAFLIVRGWYGEAALVRAELLDEVATGTVTADEYGTLPSPGARRQALGAAARGGGTPARAMLDRLFQFQLMLALQKRLRAFGDRPKVSHLHSEEALRARIADLRLRIAAPPVLQAALPGGFAPPPPPGYVAPPNHQAASSPPNYQAPPADPFVANDPRLYRLVVTNGVAAGTAIPLRDGLTLGRSPGRAEIVLPDPEVSGLHARIARNGGPPVLIDTGSTNGTWINEERIAERALRAGDRVRLGGVQLIVEAG